MRKIILFVFIAMISGSSYSQISFGCQLGGNLGLGQYKDDNYPYFLGTDLYNDPRMGLTGGFLAEIPLGKPASKLYGKLAFRPELNYIQKGSRLGILGGEKKIILNYLEIPLNVVYYAKLGKTRKVFFGLGPSIAFGLGGKIKTTSDTAGSSNTKIMFDGEKNSTDEKVHAKGFDIGADVLVGFQVTKHFYATAAFTCDFTNIYSDKKYLLNNIVYEHTYRNRSLSICVGYIFASMKKKKK